MKIKIRALVPLGTDDVKPLMPGEVGTIDRDQEQIEKALDLGLYEVVEMIAEDTPEPTVVEVEVEVEPNQEQPTGDEPAPDTSGIG